MKKLLFASLVLLSSFCFAQTRSILFIGNSYTYFNGGVDAMLKNIALAEGDTLYTESFTMGGAKFSDFCNNSETFARIRSRAWDYVVLQEQSQLPAFPPSQVEAECYPFAKRLCDSIRANDSCTQILFFMTWGRQNGDQTNCGFYEPLCTYDGMQQRLRESYVQMADDNNAIAVPVGLAWKNVRDQYPQINLYQSDESHPTVEGTYLAALTFCFVIYGYDYEISYCPENIDFNTRRNLIIGSVGAVSGNWVECNIRESLFVHFAPVWLTNKAIGAEYMGVNVTADFDSCVYSGNGVTYTVLPEDADYSTYYSYSTFYFMVEDFLANQDDTVDICFTLYRRECSYSLCEEFYYCVLGGINNVQSENLSFSNPVTNGKIQFSTDVIGNYEIYSIEGRMLDSGFVSGCEIDVSQLKNGVYMIRIGERTEKIVVNNL